MAIEDEINAEFAHMDVSLKISQALVDAAEKDLQAVPDAVIEATCKAVGVETANKKSAAQALAIAREVARVAGPLVMAAL